jgi:hypothetical protein
VRSIQYDTLQNLIRQTEYLREFASIDFNAKEKQSKCLCILNKLIQIPCPMFQNLSYPVVEA